MKKISCFLIVLFCTSLLFAQNDSKSTYPNTIKASFLSFITGSLKLTYEHETFPRQSVEFTGGIIGVGFDKFKVEPKGGLLRLAYKFILSKTQNAPLQGWYVKPEYAVSIFDYTSENAEQIRSSMQTIMGCLGYQWGIKRFIMDGFVGTGIGFGEPMDFRYHHGFIERYGKLTLTFGIRLGFAF